MVDVDQPSLSVDHDERDALTRSSFPRESSARKCSRQWVRVAVSMAASAVIAVGCGSSDDTGQLETAVADDRAADTRAPGEAVVAVDGHELTYLGWSDWPFPDVDLDLNQVRQLETDGTRLVAIRVAVCPGLDSFPMSGGVLFTVADAGGQPFGSGTEEFQKLSFPLVSEELFVWPDPGDCAEGWLQSVIPVDAAPAIVLWRNLFENEDEEYQWLIGEPVPPAELE